MRLRIFAPIVLSIFISNASAIDECHYISDCEWAYRRSKEYLDLVAAGKKVVMIQNYRTNDTVVDDVTYNNQEVLTEGLPGSEVVVVTLGGWVNAGGYISGNTLYSQPESPESFRKKEEGKAQLLADIEKKRWQKEDQAKKDLAEFNRLRELNRTDEDRLRSKNKIKLEIANKKLHDIEKEMEKKLIFGLPNDNQVLFLIDGSASVRDKMGDDINETYLKLAVKQLENMLPMLAPDQYFSVGLFSEDGPALCNDGIPVPASKENVARALDYIHKTTLKLHGGSEFFNVTLEQALRQSHWTPEKKHNSVYIFSDFDWTSEDLNKGELMLKKEESKVYVSLFGSDRKPANAARLAKSGGVLQGPGTTSFTTAEIAAIQQEHIALRKEIKELTEALK